MKFHSRIMSTMIILVFVFSISSTSQVSSQTTFDIAIVYSTGGLGDQSFNDAAKVGIDASIATHGSAITVAEACETACGISDINAALETFAAEDKYDLIIGVGFGAQDGITSSATGHPTQDFLLIDGAVDLPNVASVTFKEEEGSFLAGVMAGMVTQTGKLGFLGGLDIPLINRFAVGYIEGARHINSSIEVETLYSPDPLNLWGDIAGGKTVADEMMTSGTDIIFSAAGGTGLGIIEAVAEANTFAGEKLNYAIGVDSDQDYISAGNVLTSMIKRIDTVVETQINYIVQSTWSSGYTIFGLVENGVGISKMLDTQPEANTVYSTSFTRIEYVNYIANIIIENSIVIPTTFEDLNDFVFPKIGSTTTTTTSTTTTSPTTPSDKSSEQTSDNIETPQIELHLSLIQVVFVLVVLPIILKRKQIL